MGLADFYLRYSERPTLHLIMATKTSRPRLGFLIAAAFALSATVMPTKVKAADVYFDAVASPTGPSFFSYPGNWWTDSTSTTASLPTIGDDLFFGFGSSNADNTAIIYDLGAAFPFNSLTFSNADGLNSRTIYHAGFDFLTTGSITALAGGGNITFFTSVSFGGLFPSISAGAGSLFDFKDPISTSSPLATLTVTGAGDTIIASSLQAFALEKDGTGSLSLGSTLYQSNSLNVLNGTVAFTQSNVLVDSVVTNDADLLFTNAAGTAGVLSLGGSVSGYSSFSGNASIGARSGSGYLNLAGNSSILNLSGSGTINTALNKTLDLSEGSFSGDLTGDGSIKKVSPGTLTLSGDNSGLSADFEIFDGVVRAESLDALGSGAVTIKLTGGDLTLVSNSSQTRTNDVQISADTTITLEAFTPATLSLTQTLGDLTMGAYTLNVAQGINFDLGETATLAFGNVTLDSAGGISTFDVGAGAKLTTGSVSALANESLVVTGAGDTTIGGTFGLDAGSLTKNGNGTLTLDGSIAGSWVGGTTVNAGTLEFTQAVTLNGAVANDATLLFSDNAGITILNSGLSGSGSTTFAGDGLIRVLTGTFTSTLDFAALKTVGVGSGNFAGQLAGSGTFRKVSDGTIGAGTLVLTGNNVGLTGVVDVAAGTLQVESVDGLGSATVQLTGGNLNLVGDQNLNLGNDVQQTSSSTITIGAATPDAPSLTQSLGDLDISSVVLSVARDASFAPSATATLSLGSVSLSGPGWTNLNVNSGVNLEIRNQVNSVSNQGLVVTGAGNTAISGDVTLGNGFLYKSGSGRLTLSGLSTYTDRTYMYGGALRLNNVGALANSNLELFDGIVELAAADFSRVVGTGPGEVQFTGFRAGFSAIGAARQVTLDAAGATIDWATKLPFQTLVLADGNSTHTLTLNNALNLGVGPAYRNIEVGDGAAAVDAIITGQITGSLTVQLEKSGAGTLNLAVANAFAGDVLVSGGRLNTVSGGLAGINSAYVETGASLFGVNYRTAATLAIEQGATANFSGVASAITGTIWNNGTLTLNPALGGNSTITLDELYGSGTTNITRGSLVIYNNALNFGGVTLLDPHGFDNTLPADLTWGYGAGGGGFNVLNLIGTLTADISGGTVNTTNLFSNYIFDVDLLADALNGNTPLGVAGPGLFGDRRNVTLNVTVTGSATVGTIDVGGATGTVNFEGTAEVGTLVDGIVNLTGTLGEFTNVDGGNITSTSADVQIVNLNGGSHQFNGVQTLVTNFGNTTGGNPAATATGYISVGTMKSGTLTLQGSGPSSVITRLNGGTLNIDGSDVVVTVNSGTAIGAGATVTGTGSLTKLTAGILNLDRITLTDGGVGSGTIRLNEGRINVGGAGNTIVTAINSGILDFTNTGGLNSIGSLENGSSATVSFAADSTIGALSGSGILNINDGTKTLTIQSGSFSGAINGAGNLEKNGGGTLVLSGLEVDNYAGTTTVNGGTLQFTSAVTLGVVNNQNANLRFSSATGTTTLSSLTNNFGGSTIFTGASSVTNVLNANGATLQFNGSTTIAGSLNNLSGSSVEINAGGNINLLQGDGLTRINNAGVSINQRVNDGELQVYGSSSINQLAGNGRITLGANLSVNEGATAATIDGNGSLTKNSGGLLVLSGANVDNYTGITTVNNGTLVFEHDAIYLAGQVTVNGGGTLSFSAATGTTWINNYLVNSGSTTFGSNAILGDTYNYANTITVVGNLTGTYLESNNGGATITVGGVASLNHLRNYSGQVNINGLIGSSSIGLIQNYGGSTTIIGNATVSDVRTYGGATSIGGNLINCNYLENNANTQVSGDASISSLRNNSGTATIIGNATISDVRTYGGSTSIGGNLINCNYLENNANTQVFGNASISSLRNYSGTTSIGGNLNAIDVVNNGGQLVVVTGNANISSYLTNDGNVNFGAAATITNLYGSGTTNFAGLTQISYRNGNGTANFSDDASIASIADSGSLSIAFGKTLTLSSGSFSGSISGQGALNKTTGNTLTLSGSNVDGYQGVTTVNAGTLVFDTDVTLSGRVTNDASLNFTSGSGLTELTTGLEGSGSTSFAGNTQVGTLDGTIAATVSIANGKVLTANNGLYAGTLTGGGSLVKANGGTLALTGNGAGNYSGTTTVGAGTLTFTQAVTLGAQVTNNGTLNFTNAGNSELSTGLNGSGATNFSGDTSVGVLEGTNTAAVSIAGGKVLTVNSGSFAGSLSGGSLVKATGGLLTLDGLVNYTGTTTNTGGGTLTITQNVNLVGQVTNDATLNFNGAGTSSLTSLVGSGTTNFAGNATITSRSGTGVVNFLGNVVITAVSGSGDLDIASGKSLTIQQGSYTGSITGSGDLVKTTAGQLTLAGSPSNFGATLVQAGLLTVNSDVTTTSVTVAAGATLGGSGSINGNVVVNGILAPGNSPGVLTVTGTETLANNSSFLAEIGGTQAGTGNAFHDQSNVVGNIVLGTGVTLDIISWNGFTSVSRGDTLTLLKSTGGISGRFADTAGSDLSGWTLFDNSTDAGHLYGNLYGTGLSAGQTFAVWGTNPGRAAVAGALWTTAVTETTDSATTAGANRVGFIDTNSNAGRAALALVNAGANTDALLDSYSPEAFLGLTDYAQMTARTLSDGALNQTTSYTLGDWGIGAGYSNVSNTFTAGSSTAFDRRLSSSTTYANISYHLNSRWKAGLFYGHNIGRINSLSSSTNLNGGVVGLSLNGSIDWVYPVSLRAAITSSSLRFGSTRTMATATSGDDQIVTGSGTSTSANNKLTDTSAQVSASMLVFTKGRLSLTPSVGLVHGSSKTDAFTESGTGANLAVAGMSANSTRGVLGLGVGYEVSAELALSLSLGVEKQLNSNAESVSATFAGARDANFSVTGRDTSGSVISTLGLGVSYRLPEGYSANLNAEFRSANPYHNDKRVNLSINRRF